MRIGLATCGTEADETKVCVRVLHPSSHWLSRLLAPSFHDSGTPWPLPYLPSLSHRPTHRPALSTRTHLYDHCRLPVPSSQSFNLVLKSSYQLVSKSGRDRRLKEGFRVLEASTQCCTCNMAPSHARCLSSSAAPISLANNRLCCNQHLWALTLMSKASFCTANHDKILFLSCRGREEQRGLVHAQSTCAPYSSGYSRSRLR